MIDCHFCGSTPILVPILVYYRSEREAIHAGPPVSETRAHDMYRVKCRCGAIGKCRPTPEAAEQSWNEPWQALVDSERVTLV